MKYIVGTEKAVIKYIVEPFDGYYWARANIAQKLGLDEAMLEDEPDAMSDGSDQQGWDNLREDQ